MSEIRELSFCELRRKDIVSISDGRKLGRIVDLVFSSASGRVQGIVAPYGKKFLFFRSQEVYIPYSNIKTIGEDIILVDISSELGQRPHHHNNHNGHYEVRDDKWMGPEEAHREEKRKPERDDNYCDGRCDKCMLFDCSDRWKKKRDDVYVHDEPYK